MHPFIYIKDFPIPSYALLVLIGYFAGIIYILFATNKTNFSKKFMIISSVMALVGMFTGAKLFYCFSVLPQLITSGIIYNISILDAMHTLFGGYVFYGGMFGAVCMVAMVCYQFDYSFKVYSAYLFTAIPLVHAIGRIGCFMAGCCYGFKYSGPFCISYPKNCIVDGLSCTKRFPVQLLESLLLFVLFFALCYMNKKGYDEIVIAKTYFVIYPLLRFFIEFFRADKTRGIFLGLSTSQWISCLILFFFLLSYLKNLRNLKRLKN